MDVIDEQGRLFGIVNVIDALVVVLVVAVAVAGVALILQEPEPPEQAPETATRYATVTFGNTPPEVARSLAVGDRASIATGETANASEPAINVTDLYRVPGQNEKIFVVARVALTGRLRADSFVVDGQPIRIGNAVTLVGDAYALEGRISAVNRSGDRLVTGTTPVVLEATVPRLVASSLTQGDTVRAGTVTGATVESVSVYPTGSPDKRLVHVGVRFRTRSTSAGPEYAGRPVRVGQTRTIAPNATTVKGSVLALGTATPPGEATTVRVRVAWHDVPPSLARAVGVNTTEQLRGDTTAQVVDRRITPETVVVTAENGTVHRRDHPLVKNVTLTVDLAARRTAEGLQFHGRPLQLGRSVVLDFEAITVKGTVIGIETEP